MDYTGKRVLILGGSRVHCKIVEAAKRMGIYTIVADYLEQSPAKKLADESLLISILDADAIVKWCTENPVDAVINYSNDPVQKIHADICERLGLPRFCSKEFVAAFTNKKSFKEMCVRSGAGTIPSFAEKQAIADEIPKECYPLLVKPADSRGSRGQSICCNYDQLLNGIQVAKNESFSGEIVIEKYLEDYDDLEISYLVVDGEPYLLKLEDRYPGSKANNLDRLCIATIAPSVHDAEYREKVDPKIKKFIKDQGIQNGPVFLQGFWNDGDVYLYDPGLRIPGDNFDYAYTAITGISIPELIIEYLITGTFRREAGSMLGNAVVNKPFAQLLPCIKPGTIDEITGIDKVKALPGVVSLEMDYLPGDTIKKEGNVKQRLAEIVVIGDDYADLGVKIEEIFKLLHAKDRFGDEMLIEPFSTANLGKYYS